MGGEKFFIRNNFNTNKFDQRMKWNVRFYNSRCVFHVSLITKSVSSLVLSKNINTVEVNCLERIGYTSPLQLIVDLPEGNGKRFRFLFLFFFEFQLVRNMQFPLEENCFLKADTKKANRF